MTSPSASGWPIDVVTPGVTRDRIVELDLQIYILNDSLRRLVLERQSLQTHLDAYIYPVMTLPNEIVAEIFLCTCISAFDLSLADPPSPFPLGHICRKWREIALSTPSLWRDINMELKNIAAHDNQLRLLEAWLVRSRQCLLSISLVQKADEPYTTKKFVEAILPHCVRCQELVLHLPFHDLPSIAPELPLLSSSIIGFSDLNFVAEDPEKPWPLTIFHSAPKLKNLGIVRGAVLQNFNFPWAQITSISIRLVHHPHELACVLRGAVTLEILTAEVLFADEDGMEQLPVIPPLHHLQTLDLRHPLSRRSDPESKSQMQVLEKLTLPALRILRVSEACFIPSPVVTIKDLVARSGFPIQRLHITIDFALRGESYYREEFPSVGAITVRRLLLAVGDDTSSDTQQEA
ncbi:hypothetical protein B0H11DRAFT_1937246 [Mycena galericulata]|nr:hypothetical protein B0H11DRAFT_1937246 [Mycena galericulata]